MGACFTENGAFANTAAHLVHGQVYNVARDSISDNYLHKTGNNLVLLILVHVFF